MQVESVLALRQEIFERGWTDLFHEVTFGLPKVEREMLEAAPFPVALGVTGAPGRDDAKLAVRAWERTAETELWVRSLRERAAGEIDVVYTGRVLAQEGTPLREKTRPLLIGSSCAHLRVSFGTLGGFVERDGQNLLLSNNHVLARENLATLKQAVLQPASGDNGVNPASTVGGLVDFAPLGDRHNQVDAAIAGPLAIAFDPRTITGVGVLAGVRDNPLATGERVSKLGRTTAITHGKVRAWDLHEIKVRYRSGQDRWFDHQIEIEPDGSGPFSERGDSGSLVVDSECKAAGLLFGGASGFSYANQIGRVLEALRVTLAS